MLNKNLEIKDFLLYYAIKARRRSSVSTVCPVATRVDTVPLSGVASISLYNITFFSRNTNKKGTIFIAPFKKVLN